MKVQICAESNMLIKHCRVEAHRQRSLRLQHHSDFNRGLSVSVAGEVYAVMSVDISPGLTGVNYRTALLTSLQDVIGCLYPRKQSPLGGAVCVCVYVYICNRF